MGLQHRQYFGPISMRNPDRHGFLTADLDIRGQAAANPPPSIKHSLPAATGQCPAPWQLMNCQLRPLLDLQCEKKHFGSLRFRSAS